MDILGFEWLFNATLMGLYVPWPSMVKAHGGRMRNSREYVHGNIVGFHYQYSLFKLDIQSVRRKDVIYVIHSVPWEIQT